MAKRDHGKAGEKERELLVLRHGKSDWNSDAKRDFDRPLAKRGRKDADRMGAWLRKRGLRPDLVVSSPAKRAKQTTLRILEALELDEAVVKWEPRVYEAGRKSLLAVLAELPRSARRVLLVGHNPALEDLVHHLAAEEIPTPKNGKFLPTAALAHFVLPQDWGRLERGKGDLVSLVRPKDLKK
jgi:phosphohistidine phosphatase